MEAPVVPPRPTTMDGMLRMLLDFALAEDDDTAEYAFESLADAAFEVNLGGTDVRFEHPRLLEELKGLRERVPEGQLQLALHLLW